MIEYNNDNYSSNSKDNNLLQNLRSNSFSRSPYKSPYNPPKQLNQGNMDILSQDRDTNFTTNSQMAFTKIPTSTKFQNTNFTPFSTKERDYLNDFNNQNQLNNHIESINRNSKIVPYNTTILNKFIDLLFNW